MPLVSGVARCGSSSAGRGSILAMAILIVGTLSTVATLGLAQQRSISATGAARDRQVIILKLDDLYQYGKRATTPRWEKIADYIEKNQLKACFGIICDSLEVDNAAYFNWIKDHQKKGYIEFFCHGYHFRTLEDKHGEFEAGSAAEQQAVLEKAQQMAKTKLGFPLAGFGPHWSLTTEETEKALQAVPEFKVWLLGPKDSKFYSKLSLERVIPGLEYPTFMPDFEKFKTAYEKYAATKAVLVLNGHPNRWDDARWDNFIKIIDYLKARGCVFQTPSEYLSQSGNVADGQQ